MIDTASPSQLLDEVRALRRKVEALESASQMRQRLELRAVRPGPFLGQPVTMVARITDARTGAPRPEVPITFLTTWGRLRRADQPSVQETSSLIVRTGPDGTVQVTLAPPTTETLQDAQQSALEGMLRLLDGNARTPADTEAGFREMAREYGWDANLEFRRAVDIYLRDFRPSLLDTVNLEDHMRVWLYFPSTVTAYALESGSETEPTSVQAAASLNLQFKDWLAPWLQTLLDQVESESSFRGDLDGVRQQGNDAGQLADGVHSRIREFLGQQHGLAGQYVGQKVVDRGIRDFLTTGLEELPGDTRVALFPALEATAKTMAVSREGGLLAVD